MKPVSFLPRTQLCKLSLITTLRQHFALLTFYPKVNGLQSDAAQLDAKHWFISFVFCQRPPCFQSLGCQQITFLPCCFYVCSLFANLLKFTAMSSPYPLCYHIVSIVLVFLLVTPPFFFLIWACLPCLHLLFHRCFELVWFGFVTL